MVAVAGVAPVLLLMRQKCALHYPAINWQGAVTLKDVTPVKGRSLYGPEGRI